MEQYRNEPFARTPKKIAHKTRYILNHTRGHHYIMQICKFDLLCNELPICDALKCTAKEFLVVFPKMQKIVSLLNSSKDAILGVKVLEIESLDSIIERLEKYK